MNDTISKLWRLSTNDFVKGLIVAVLSGVLTLILDLLKAGSVINWSQIGTVALIAMLSYLLKNFGTDSRGKILGKGESLNQ